MDEIPYNSIYDDQTLQILESQFTRMKDNCYVDHAGSTLYSDDQIRQVAQDLISTQYGNPHSHGVVENTTGEVVEYIRTLILNHFHTNQEEYSVIFTSGATGALKTVAETFDFGLNDSGIKGSFVYLQDNHTSVLGMREIVAQNGAPIVCIDHKTAFKCFQTNSFRRKSSPSDHKSNSLFIYPGQCNFSGVKYPMSWVELTKTGSLDVFASDETNWHVFVDAACLVSTSDVDLSIFKPDFMCMSFYKLFGYPTGLGALLVRNSSAKVLKKNYYGGGTVQVALSSKQFHVKRELLHERFEDGTISFLSIASLKYGFEVISKISIRQISTHVFSLAKYLHHSLLMLHHQNGKPVIKLYSDTDYEDQNLQGGIVTFNVIRSSGEYVGYMEVLSMAAIYKIHLRVGCFCNPGACQRHLDLSNEDILRNYDSGYTCSGSRDLIEGKPTGCVRVSFGYMSTFGDVETIIKMIKKCFVTGIAVFKVPDWWQNFKKENSRKYFVSCEHDGTSNGITNNGVKKNENYESNGIEIHDEKIDLNPRIKKISSLKISRIFIYPIKSCAAFEINSSWKLDSRGLEFDREWMIMTSNGVCLTQKHESNMCLIVPNINLETNQLQLNYPGMPTFSISLDYESQNLLTPICQGKVCGAQRKGIFCGEEISEWLSLALQRPNLKLVRHCKEKNGEKMSKKPELSFASQSQYLLINEASICWLGNKISENSECNKKTMLHRFRGNIVITGGSPFEEITWKTLKLGNCLFKVEGPCKRCQMVCIDQTTGAKTVEPLRTLAEEFHGKLSFGIYLTKKSLGNHKLQLGDGVYFD